MAGACYSERVDRALGLVAAAFRTHARKGSNVPYLSHLLAVAALVAEHGGDEDQIIAALLHDYLEDVDGSASKEIEQHFGPRVAQLVLGLSDSTAKPKPPWEARKRGYLGALRSEPAELKLISAADKLHNALSMVRDYRVVGDELWERFTPSREQTLWYYRSVLVALGDGWTHPLLDELARAVDELEQLTTAQTR
jgi:(p)ppGpp synthase/HD superfamily hydrolase